MHIVINSRFLTQNITGVQRFAIEISKQLKKQLGDNVQFVSPRNIIHSELAKELDVKVIGNKTGHLWEQLDLPKYLKSINFPLLLNLANTAPFFYRNKIVTVYDLAFYHHPEWFSRKFVLAYNFLIPKICKNAKHILTDSNYVKNDISESYNISTKRITTVYGSYSNVFRQLNLLKEDFVLAVGSIDPRKNLLKLIDIFKESKTNLVIVGQENKVFSALNIGNLPNNIRFTGYINDEELVELYNKARLFIYPSFFEGFGIPPLEAQACGCPVVCSNVTSLPEVGGVDSVVYCNPYNVEDIKEKIELVLNDENLQNDLKSKGFENIKRFSWEESAKKIMEVIGRLK